jgi:hypothetical protein
MHNYNIDPSLRCLNSLKASLHYLYESWLSLERTASARYVIRILSLKLFNKVSYIFNGLFMSLFPLMYSIIAHKRSENSFIEGRPLIFSVSILSLIQNSLIFLKFRMFSSSSAQLLSLLMHVSTKAKSVSVRSWSLMKVIMFNSLNNIPPKITSLRCL